MYDVGKHGWMPDGKPGSMKCVAYTEFAGGTRDYSENVVAKIFTLYLTARIPSQQEMVALYEFGCLDATLGDDVARKRFVAVMLAEIVIGAVTNGT